MDKRKLFEISRKKKRQKILARGFYADVLTRMILDYDSGHGVDRKYEIG